MPANMTSHPNGGSVGRIGGTLQVGGQQRALQGHQTASADLAEVGQQA